MDCAVKKTNLLILSGVFPRDFAPIDDIYKEAAVPQRAEPTIVYTEIPKKFTGASSWVKFSNLRCWECDQLPTSYPKFIPMYPTEDARGQDVCDVLGHFCEWNCAVRYAIREFPKDRQPDILEAICLFESKFTGKRREKIMPAPPKTEMRPYCGKNGLTLKQWRDKYEQINVDYSLSQYRLGQFCISAADRCDAHR